MEQNPILSARLSMDSDIPLYAQLVGIIKRNISTGTLAVGDLLPSEAELCRWMNISRNTVRQAIGELEDEGLVVRKRGRGTFVADPATNRRGVRYSFTTEVSSLGKVPSSTLIDFDVIVPSQAVCEKMELREGTPVYCFTRVRNVDGEPLILETSYYPEYIYPIHGTESDLKRKTVNGQRHSPVCPARGHHQTQHFHRHTGCGRSAAQRGGAVPLDEYQPQHRAAGHRRAGG